VHMNLRLSLRLSVFGTTYKWEQNQIAHVKVVVARSVQMWCSTGRLFHSHRGPAAVKLLSPICDCICVDTRHLMI